MKRLKKLNNIYCKADNKIISKEQLQQCAEYYCNSLKIDISTIEVDNSYKAYASFGNESEFKVTIDFYNDKNGPEIDRIITGSTKEVNRQPHYYYIETKEQQYLDNFLSNSNNFIYWIENSLESIKNLAAEK